MTEPLHLGVDVGTGSARAGLFTAGGELVGRGEYRIKTWQERPDHVEQSSNDIWQAVCQAVAGAITDAGVDGENVKSIGFDATCSLVALDEAGEPVSVSVDGGDERNVVVWMDHRAIDDALQINATGHPVLEYVGGAISPEMQTPKLRWLKRELPASWVRTRHWFDLPDFLTWRATGKLDRSLCSLVCKWTYLGHEERWDESYFDAIGLGDIAAEPARIGVDVRAPGAPIGELTPAAARELGLPQTTVVAASLIDAHAGALGILGAGETNVALEHRMAVIAGTSACHLAVTGERQPVPGIWGPYYGALLPGRWLLEGGISASGAFLDHVLGAHPASGESNVFERSEKALTRLLESGVDAAVLTGDLHFQCNLLGNRSPLADPRLTGGISGWRLDGDERSLARWYLAALESFAYATRHIVDAVNGHGGDVKLLVVSGTSATSPRWRQVHADALGIPIVVPDAADGVLLGSAMLGAVACGAYASLQAAMNAMCGSSKIVSPNVAMASHHTRKYQVYLRMIEDQRAYTTIMEGK